jgi:biopolymer transport protein ExbB
MSLASLLSAGGWPMLPIYACSVVALAVFARKLLDFAGGRLDDRRWLDGALAAVTAGDLNAAAKRCRDSRAPAARAALAAIETWPGRPDRAEAEAGRIGSLELQRLERHLGLLSFIAHLAPILGLLGTAIGMVRLFYDLERTPAAAVDVSALSSGIWTALLTTAAGLIVAVVALSAHAYLASRLDRVRLHIHDAVERTLTALPPGAGGHDAAG